MKFLKFRYLFWRHLRNWFNPEKTHTNPLDSDAQTNSQTRQESSEHAIQKTRWPISNPSLWACTRTTQLISITKYGKYSQLMFIPNKPCLPLERYWTKKRIEIRASKADYSKKYFPAFPNHFALEAFRRDSKRLESSKISTARFVLKAILFKTILRPKIDEHLPKIQFFSSNF